MRNLQKLISEVLEKGLALKDAYIAAEELTFEYLNIFTEDTKDYESLVEQALKVGDVDAEHEKGIRIKLSRPIDQLAYIQIAKPRDDREGYIGFIDLKAKDFKMLKDTYQTQEGFELQNKGDFERLIVKEPENNVMIYIQSKSWLSDMKDANAQTQSSNLEALISELKSKNLQLMADFQNYKKRMDAERATFGAVANMGLIQELLEIHDDMQLALQDENLDLDNAKSSMKTAQEKLIGAARNAGIERVEIKVGDEFNKEKMEAITTVPDSTMKDKVIAVISSAYKHVNQENILKPAKVIVGK